MEMSYGDQHSGSKTTAAAAAKSLQSCSTVCNPTDGSPPGSPVPGILQARTLEWVAISFSNAWNWKVKGKSLSRVQLFATPWTAAYQSPPSMGFSRQEYWSGVPLPSPSETTSTPQNSKISPKDLNDYHKVSRFFILQSIPPTINHSFLKNGLFLFIFLGGPLLMACGILVSQPVIKPGPPVMEVQSPNHWTAREFPK